MATLVNHRVLQAYVFRNYCLLYIFVLVLVCVHVSLSWYIYTSSFDFNSSILSTLCIYRVLFWPLPITPKQQQRINAAYIIAFDVEIESHL